MKRCCPHVVPCLSFVLVLACMLSVRSVAQTSADWKPVETTLGRTGKVQPDGVLKFGMPRKDLKVTVAGTLIKPGLAVGSWCAVSWRGDSAMVMGDLVLVEDEVAPVMAKLQAGGIDISALHNHVLRESPRVMYMHIAGHGNAVKLAQARLPKPEPRPRLPLHPPRRKSISTPTKLIRPSAAKEKTTAAFINSASRELKPFAITAWRLRPQWGLQPQSTSSLRETEKRRSQAILCCSARK